MATSPVLHVPVAGPASGLDPDLAQPSAGAWPIREHGTAGRYRRGPDIDDQPGKGCRCDRCTAAQSRAVNLCRLRVAEGRSRVLVDAGPARAHVVRLREQGLPLTSIAVLAGVPHATVRVLVNGSPSQGKPPTRRVSPGTERALLAVRADRVADGIRVLAVGTRRRLQALAWRGWPAVRIAAKAELTADYVRRLTRGDVGPTITARTAARLAAVFAELRDADPLAGGVDAQRYAQVRRLAADGGYVSWLAWDDIDDPQAKPTGVRKEAAP